MFKKLMIVSSILAVTSSVAFAGHNYKGDYKGEALAQPCPAYQFAAGPYLGLSAGPRVNYTGSPAAYNGIEGTLSAGYAFMLSSSWYLAGEVFGGDSGKVKDFTTTLNNNSGVKSSWSYGFDLLPGYMITDHALAYLRAGVVRTRFSDSNQGTNSTGWQVGLGGQTSIMPSVDARLEYIYTGYNSVTGIGKPQASQFNFGIVYKFL